MFSNYLATLTGWVWNYPVIILCLGSALFFTFYQLKFIQFRCFRHAIDLVKGKYDNPNELGHITHFQALSAALSGTIGLGNIAGVAIAISMGGPGAVFWMILIGLFAMATKYVECALGTLYRDVDEETKEVKGGPMYYITKGLKNKFLATLYAFFAILGSIGAGNMFQSNQSASALSTYYGVPSWITGLILAILVGIVILGGIKRIGQVAGKIVPVMCFIYVCGALLICLTNVTKLPGVIHIILHDAFSGSAAAGGSIGTVIIWGIRRAVFSNEAGMGSAAIAHAAVKTDYPIREGIVASLGPLIDTVIVCSATAMTIILSGLYGANAGGLSGIALTIAAFDSFFNGFGSIFISISVCLFAFSTMITWSYYGEIASSYIFGKKAIIPFKILFCLLIFYGSVNSLTNVLNFSDLAIGLMVVPNMIAILLLSKEIKIRTRHYFENLKAGKIKPYI